MPEVLNAEASSRGCICNAAAAGNAANGRCSDAQWWISSNGATADAMESCLGRAVLATLLLEQSDW